MQISVEIARHPARFAAILALGIAVVIAFAASNALALVNDSGTVDVRVPDNTTSVVDATTNAGAYVSYFGDNDTTFGSSGTGVFDPFVRLQASPTESGYNTDGTLEFDTKSGIWTHAILVSHIPQRPCGPGGAQTCFELFNDINESNAQQNALGRISLNKVEVFYTDDQFLTGYPFTGDATLEYAFEGDILINDVNQGSGRGDLRYNIPVGDGANEVPLPADCDYGNPDCDTYFVLYSEWGLTVGFGDDFTSEGGFEEWKVKIYPAISLTKTPNPADVCNGSSTDVTYTYVVTNNSPGGGSVDGTIADDNATPGNLLDDVTVGTFSNLGAGDSDTFTHVFTVSGTRTNIATATATDSNGETATATATATVTGHTCTISLTKTPNVTDVCAGANTSVTYTYVVTNTGDFFNASGSITDNVLGSIGSFGPLAPGASATLTKTATINATTNNTGTASATFDDAASTTATATASATVTARTCTISLTKTPDITSVCAGFNTSVTYTYVVTNTGNFFNASGSITDDVLGSIGSFGPLAPGASATLTKSATINATTTNTGTATATFDDPASFTATATASATVNAFTCSITVTKVCQDATSPGGDITFNGTVTNNGTAALTNVTVVDDHAGLVLGPINLAAGASANYSGSYTPTTSPSTNTVTATGTALGNTVTATASATCIVPAGEGCTPGYWRNHLDNWPEPYDPSDLFSAVFGRELPGFSGITLEEAVNLGGGDWAKLGRHAVAALLNSAEGLSNGYTVAGVIAAVQAAIDSGNAEPTASEFAASNELGCPLNN